MDSRNTSESFFHVTPGERAAFEAGIKLGGIFHQFTGTPVSLESAESLEKAIEDTVQAQPFVEEIHVRINRGMLEERCRKGTNEIGEGYTTLTGEMLDVRLAVFFLGKRAVCMMRYVEELDYPLMFVDRIEDV